MRKVIIGLAVMPAIAVGAWVALVSWPSLRETVDLATEVAARAEITDQPAAVPLGGRIMGGTSFVTPSIAALVTVQVSAGAPPSLEAVRHVLAPHAIDLDVPGKDDMFGWGLVNLWPRCPR